MERLKAEHAEPIEAGELTIVPGDLMEVDFVRSEVRLRGGSHDFPPLGSVPQSLVVAGGIEKVVRTVLSDQ